jgi:hypothetical protein
VGRGNAGVHRLSPHNTYQAPGYQEADVFRALGLIGSRERWSKGSVVSPSPGFASVVLAQRELCTQHLSGLGRREIVDAGQPGPIEAQGLGRSAVRGGKPLQLTRHHWLQSGVLAFWRPPGRLSPLHQGRWGGAEGAVG